MERQKDKKVIMQTIPNKDNELIGFTNICRWKDIKSETNYIEIATRCTPRSLLASCNSERHKAAFDHQTIRISNLCRLGT